MAECGKDRGKVEAYGKSFKYDCNGLCYLVVTGEKIGQCLGLDDTSEETKE